MATPDMNNIVKRLLESAAPQAHVAPNRSGKLAYPAIIFHLSSTGRIGGVKLSRGRGIWRYSLSLTILATPSTVRNLIDTIYQTVWTWAGKQHIQRIEDDIFFEEVASFTADAKTIIQFDGVFTLQVHNIT